MSRPRTPTANIKAVKQAIEIIGSQAETARRLGVRQSAVTKWVNGKVSAERAMDLERLTEGAVTKQQIRPDLFS